MLKNIMTLFQLLKLIFLLPLWLVYGLLLGSTLLVCWLMLMILCLVSFPLTWLLAVTLPKEQVSESTLEEYELSTAVLEEVRYNTLVLSLSLKNLKQLLSAVLKTELEVVRQLFTFRSGTPKQKILL